ncbi:DUF3127 domain-containing protein [Lutibacter holmesii]|uniref:DUF3127 domain-containing protein n=1 Tax=Lutibacter holmesii TaxID=1137985 RepID=A0ABW3WLS5_9FLAO
MEVVGKIKKIDETKTYGASGFRKREMVVTTNEQYPQPIMMEFVQDKCDLLNKFKIGDDVKVSINLRGREWINPEGEAVYFNQIQGWRIEAIEEGSAIPPAAAPVAPVAKPSDDNNPDDLPF